MTTLLLDRPDICPDELLAEIAAELTRRRFLGSGAALGAGLLIGGCADDSDDPDDTALPSEVGSPTPSSSPIRVSHKYGETEVPNAPQRVVSLGFVDHDSLLALGVVPVAIGGDEVSDLQRSAVWPWAQDKLGAAAPAVISYVEIDIEKIAALAPDLITGFSSGMTQAEYEQLSKLAPTVAQVNGYPDYFAPWQEITRAAGRTLGRLAEAEALIAGVEDTFAKARAEHPEFDGVQAAYASTLEDAFYTENSRSSRAAILLELGFEIPPEIDDLADGDATYADVSAERLDLLDHDVLVWELPTPQTREVIEGSPVYETLDVAKEDRDVFVDDTELVAAMAYISVLSLPTVVEKLVPLLATAVSNLAGAPASASPTA